MSSYHRQQSSNYVYQFSGRNDDTKYRQYQKGKLLGQGGFAECYKATRLSDNRTFAMKVIKLNDKKEYRSASKDKHKSSKHNNRYVTQEKAYAQVKFLKMCNHENIVQYETDFIYQNGFYIIMELCENGVLLSLYQSFSDLLKNRGKVLYQSNGSWTYVSQIKKNNSSGVLHFVKFSLKPANYLLTSSLQLKIADFGLATEVRHNVPYLKNICGTPNYISPEMLDKREYSYQVDVWSIGVILYSMLYGMPPFETKRKNANQTYDRIKKCSYQLNNPNISDQAKSLITKILVLDPLQRIPLERIFQHPFMTNCSIPKYLPAKYLREDPDSRYLRQFEKQRKTQKYINKVNKQVFRQKEPPFRFYPATSNSNSMNKSFAENSDMEFRDSKQSKKYIKKQKSETKQIEKSLKNERKSIAQALQKMKDQQMQTSNPISCQMANNTFENKNKYIQYPSSEHNSNNLQLVRIKNNHKNSSKSNDSHKIIEQNELFAQKNIHKKQNKKQECLENYITQKTPFEPVLFELKPFPSFLQLMKPISIEKMFSNPKYESYVRRQYTEFVDSIKKQSQKQLNQMDKFININEQKYQMKNLKSKHLESQYLKENGIFIMEDLLILSPSLHESSKKMIKMIYCLKQQTYSQNCNRQYQHQENIKNNTNSNCSRVIGTIFSDNSSIITQIIKQQNNFVQSSYYIKNVQQAQNINSKINYSQPFIIPPANMIYFENHQNNLVKLNSDMLEKLKSSNKQEIQKNGNYERLDFDLRVKIRYAKDGIRCFKNTLINSYPQLFNSNEFVNNGLADKIQANNNDPLIKKQHNLIFVKYYSSKRKYKLYFQLNDGSNHYLQKYQSKRNYLDLFKSNIKQKRNIYNSIIYFPIKGIAFLKKTDQQIRLLSQIEFEDKFQNIVNNKCPENNHIKVFEDDEDQDDNENYYENKSKKLKIDTNTEIVKNDCKPETLYLKLSSKQQQITPEIASSSPSQLISQLCVQFRQKLQMFYIKQRDMLRMQKTNKLKAGKQYKTTKQNHSKENHCWFEIKDGRIDYKTDKQRY